MRDLTAPSRAQVTASAGSTPLMTARNDMAVPVRPIPPPQAISTRSRSARVRASPSALIASSMESGREKSRHLTHLYGQPSMKGSLPSK